jgi:hypothetical protein
MLGIGWSLVFEYALLPNQNASTCCLNVPNVGMLPLVASASFKISMFFCVETHLRHFLSSEFYTF